ncbi:hypothetical protein Q3G72_001143 [Acer saccharum]|nr:hypothetical protein Q3G72_031967 [Acer saccharum]KAK1591032.1 hypothetical protein Q3G72_001143 [Acer saccharum]
MKKLKYAGSLADRVVWAEAEAAKVAEQLKKTKVSPDGSGKKQQPTKSAADKPNLRLLLSQKYPFHRET